MDRTLFAGNLPLALFLYFRRWLSHDGEGNHSDLRRIRCAFDRTFSIAQRVAQQPLLSGGAAAAVSRHGGDGLCVSGPEIRRLRGDGGDFARGGRTDRGAGGGAGAEGARDFRGQGGWTTGPQARVLDPAGGKDIGGRGCGDQGRARSADH
ncbi:hypothetical protein SDC9_108967 [bioreactor metagenome]|uniref:Uncharacterized protein n=1 Tax=bioreactor metagenome TaxID=1076179 RepID=A0A645BBR5_9ZZZZ